MLFICAIHVHSLCARVVSKMLLSCVLGETRAFVRHAWELWCWSNRMSREITRYIFCSPILVKYLCFYKISLQIFMFLQDDTIYVHFELMNVHLQCFSWFLVLDFLFIYLLLTCCVLFLGSFLGLGFENIKHSRACIPGQWIYSLI